MIGDIRSAVGQPCVSAQVYSDPGGFWQFLSPDCTVPNISIWIILSYCLNLFNMWIIKTKLMGENPFIWVKKIALT